MREVASELRRPVMLYSTGKDSSVMLHLARKAFHPSAPPFPLLHVDTTWKFPEMYAFRDRMPPRSTAWSSSSTSTRTEWSGGSGPSPTAPRSIPKS